jgi:hypothetical protein
LAGVSVYGCSMVQVGSLSMGCTIIAGCTNEYQISSCQYQAVKNHILFPCHVQSTRKQTSKQEKELDSFLSVPKNKLIITIPLHVAGNCTSVWMESSTPPKHGFAWRKNMMTQLEQSRSPNPNLNDVSN